MEWIPTGTDFGSLARFKNSILERKNEGKKEETTGQKYNGLPYSTGRP